MGICLGSLSETNYPDSEWKSTPENPYCFIMENRNDKNQKLLKWITTKSQQKQIYDWRNQSKQKHMVKLYEIIQTTNPYCLFLITEQLIKLEELKLTLNQAYYIFFHTLEAYIKLVDKMGWFMLEQDNIFLDCDSTVKIWINRNLAVNTVQKTIREYNQQYILSHLQVLINSKIKGKDKINLPAKYNFYTAFIFLKKKINENFIRITTRISKNLHHKRNKSQSILNYPGNSRHTYRKSMIVETQPIVQANEEANNQSISIFPHKIKFITAGSKLNRVRNYAPKPKKNPTEQKLINYQTYKENFKKPQHQKNQYNMVYTNQNSRYTNFVNNSMINIQEQIRKIQSRLEVKKINEDLLFS